MGFILPDIGTLLLSITLVSSSLIVVFEALERRREGRRERRHLEEIDREYRDFQRLGYF